MRADDTQSEPTADARREGAAPGDGVRLRGERPARPYILLDELPPSFRSALSGSTPSASQAYIDAELFRGWARDHIESPGLRQWCDDLLEWAANRTQLAALIEHAGLPAGAEVRVSSPSYYGNPWQVFVADDKAGFVDREGRRVALRGKWRITESVRARPVVERADEPAKSEEESPP